MKPQLLYLKCVEKESYSLITNAGTIKAVSVDFESETMVESFQKVFRPGFENVLKEKIFIEIDHGVKGEYASSISII
jgi:hypothetical protein